MTELRPFQVSVPEAELEELRMRLRAARWPTQLPDAGPQDGVLPGTMRALVARWLDGYDWRARERELNRRPQVTTEVFGQTVYAMTVASGRPDAEPLVLLHGWPSSVVEFSRVIDALTSPPDPADPAFHVVVPALPGYGFSGPTTERGWSTARMASAVAELMARLGYERYLAHGSDVGFHVASDIAVVDAARVRGIHLNLGGVRLAGQHAAEEPRDEEEARALQRYRRYVSDGSGYALLQATRPESLAYGLTDSPIGQLAWIAEKFEQWVDPRHPVPVDDILTTASIYWFTRTANSSARTYQESYGGRGGTRPYVDVPTSVTVFPHDIVPPIRAWAEEWYRIVDWAQMPAGGHFAALERPDLMVDALRRFARAVDGESSARH